MAVNLIDPLDPNINTGRNPDVNTNMINGIPQYQDMYIFAELTAVRRGRTILSTNIDGNITKLHEKSGFDSDVKISFLGENQQQNDINDANFTTNWYDGSIGGEMTQYEGFGIESIDVQINSSYIPQIKISFIDIRGLAFFNRDDSPYRIIFDFPPPIFFLTFKGYYGKAITYQMHLVKYTSEFKSETGNYHIDAQFMAISYAPLTDVLFRHIVQVGLFGENSKKTLDNSLSPNPVEPPVNTLDLILKLKNLYSVVGDKIKDDLNNKVYEDSQKKLNAYNTVINILGTYNENETLTKQGNPILFKYDDTFDSNVNNDSDFNLTEIKFLSDYNSVVESYQTTDIPKTINPKLYVGFKAEINNNNQFLNINIPTQNDKKYVDALTEFKIKYLTDKTNGALGTGTITSSDFEKIEEIRDDKTLGNIIVQEANERYIALDVTDYYFKLLKKKADLEKKKNESMNILNTKINNMIHSTLGMTPTIYNIFEILLKDVDTYFQKLRTVSINAEEHHNNAKNKNKIINDDSFKDKKGTNKEKQTIYSFPLVVEEQPAPCNMKTEVRRAPIKLSKRLDTPFPELSFVQEFINSFTQYNALVDQATQKTQEDSRGDYRWIPFSPVDSILVSNSQHSPYWGMDSPAGNTESQPINKSELPRLDQVLATVLRRFYIFSQNTVPYTYFNQDVETNDRELLYRQNNDISNNYIELYAKAEAVNLANSMSNSNYLDLLKYAVTDAFNFNPDAFYNYLENSVNLNSLYNATPESYNISDSPPLYINKDGDYQGISIISLNNIQIREGGGENTFLDDFWEDFKTEWWKKILYGKKNREEGYKFIKENLIFINDGGFNEESNSYDILRTKYLAFIQRFTLLGGKNIGYVNYVDTPQNKEKRENLVNNLLTQGNQYFFEKNISGSHKKLGEKKQESDTDSLDLWGQILSENCDAGSDFYNIVIKESDPKLTALMYLSSFGHATAAFNYYPYFLNADFFATPSIMEIPTFLMPYMGLLASIENDEIYINYLKEFFLTGAGKDLYSIGLLIFADLHDIKKYLAPRDKELLIQQFNIYFDNTYIELKNSVLSLVNKVNSEVNEAGTNKYQLYISNLEEGGDYNIILNSYLLKREALVNYNEITFRFAIDNENGESTGNYKSLSNLNTDETAKQKNDLFFKQFFVELNRSIIKRKDFLQKRNEEFRQSTGDEDIITQLYYSFKNINDKWLAGLNKNNQGYPFKNVTNKDLIGQFAFVDRAMNPIGDTIINPQLLTTALDDPNISIFTVMSQLLSVNGFQFFPLQSFLKFEEDEWEESFLIDTGSFKQQFPVFVCMYLGGESSYPTGIQNFGDFEDDGIVDIESPNVSGFNTINCDETTNLDDKQIETATNNVYSQVRAFKVRYAEQNQSMFANITIDSKEYPETDESIQILSRLAGDNRQNAPIPKAQNLYSLFENRSYQATITGLGNAMIQPTQYFQLENVPLFNGAYLILNVEHNITPNKMVTSFSGTKLLKYPMPRVLNPSAIVGFDGGSTTETNENVASASEITRGRGTADNPSNAQLNSMYFLKIR